MPARTVLTRLHITEEEALLPQLKAAVLAQQVGTSARTHTRACARTHARSLARARALTHRDYRRRRLGLMPTITRAPSCLATCEAVVYLPAAVIVVVVVVVVAAAAVSSSVNVIRI